MSCLHPSSLCGRVKTVGCVCRQLLLALRQVEARNMFCCYMYVHSGDRIRCHPYRALTCRMSLICLYYLRSAYFDARRGEVVGRCQLLSSRNLTAQRKPRSWPQSREKTPVCKALPEVSLVLASRALSCEVVPLDLCLCAPGNAS